MRYQGRHQAKPPARPLLPPKGQGLCYCAEEIAGSSCLGNPHATPVTDRDLNWYSVPLGTPQQAQGNGGTGRPLTTPAHETSKTARDNGGTRSSFDDPHKPSHDQIGTGCLLTSPNKTNHTPVDTGNWACPETKIFPKRTARSARRQTTNQTHPSNQTSPYFGTHSTGA
jgi:hypothetical protein